MSYTPKHDPELCPICRAIAEMTETEWMLHNRAVLGRMEQEEGDRGGLCLPSCLMLFGGMIWLGTLIYHWGK